MTTKKMRTACTFLQNLNHIAVNVLNADRKAENYTQLINVIFRTHPSTASKHTCTQMFTSMNAKTLPVAAKYLWKPFRLRNPPKFAPMR